MSQRVKISAGSGSPFRVAIPGADLESAAFNQIIFDGNQRPLRLYGTGYIYTDKIPYGAWNQVVGTQGPYTFATPAGTYPIVIGNSRPTNWPNPAFQRLSGFQSTSGQGIALHSNNVLWGLNFDRQIILPEYNIIVPPDYVNYCIFKNYG